MKGKSNPWKIKSNKRAYETPWIAVNHLEVVNPAGKDAIYGTIHFKNIAVGILPLDKDYNTWIVGQYRLPIEQFSWEMPEGGGDLNVPPIDSAKRELLEETGIVAQKWTELLKIHTSNSVTDEWGMIYIAQDLSFHAPQPDEDEELEIKKLPFNDLFEMVMKGEITDSLTLAAVLKAKQLIDSGKI